MIAIEIFTVVTFISLSLMISAMSVLVLITLFKMFWGGFKDE
jgi:hypothetical protein|nr:MAG TPA: hypothetical protein [Caudoviricetes sp.]